jgi:hypothetical protein
LYWPLVSHHMTERHILAPTELAAPPKSLLPQMVKCFI